MKKVFIAALAAAMSVSAGVSAAAFTDVQGHWAEESINALSAAGVINGVTPTEFQPDGNVTRAQYLKMIMEATGIETAEYRYGECLDAKAGDWYAPYLQGALDAGVIPEYMVAGYKAEVNYEVDENGEATSSEVIYSGAFNGELPIDREEMAVLTQYCYQYSRTVLTDDRNEIDNEGASSFTDADSISDWAKVSVNQAVEHGFMNGMDDGSFKPKDTATRAQAAAVILRVMNS